MSEVRTIPWESISDWFAKNEQQIRDVMKFEGLRGAVNEILRIAPDQPELDAQRLRADTAEAERDSAVETISELSDKVVAAEQRIAELLQICRDIQDDPRLCIMVNAELSGRISAALNPKPEAGSHE